MVVDAEPTLHELVPQAIEAERRVLGIALIDPEGAIAMAEALGENDFFRPVHRHVARVITELTLNGDVVDPVSVADALTRQRLAPPMGEIAPGGGWLAFTTSLLQAAAADIFRINPSYEVKLVRRTAFQRALIDATGKMAARAYDDDVPPEDALVFAQNLLEGIGKRFKGQGVRASDVDGHKPKPKPAKFPPIYEAYAR